MKKLADNCDKKGNPINIGDLVFFCQHSFGSKRRSKQKKLGKIIRINGGYFYVAPVLIPENNWEVWELYSTEIEKATPEKATLWMLEN